MENSKLISLLKTFSEPELDRLIDFAKSPYHNNNQDLIKFLEYLQKQHPTFPTKNLEKEIVFQSVFPKEPYDHKKLSYHMSYLLKLSSNFLGIQQFEKKEALKECMILSEFTQRNLGKHFNLQYKSLQNRLEGGHINESESMYYQYLLKDIAVDHFMRHEVRKFDENLQVASDALDDFYFLQKLKYSCEMLNRQAILSDQFAIPFMEEVKQYLVSKDQINPLIAIYLQIYFSLTNLDQPVYFEQLIELIKEKNNTINKEDLRGIYIYTINICARKIREGKDRYLNTALELYEEGIKNKALYDNNYLSQWTYNNILKLALRLRRFEWFEDFIHRYNKDLRPQFRADALQYNLAEFFYQKEDLEQTLYHLNKVNFKDINYLLGSRILLIKTFYESDAIDAALSALASFKIYLRRNKQIASSIKKSCLNFCDLFYQITKFNQPNIEELKQRIATTQPLTEKAWLIKVFQQQFN